MAKLCTEKVFVETERGVLDGSLLIKFDINVNQSGEFTTTLPKEIVEQLENAQIIMLPNRAGNKGYLHSNTKDGLIKQVSELAKEYVSRELVSEKIVLKYSIETQMSYQLTKDGEVVPNGAIGNGTGWKGGTKSTDATHRAPYGLRVYVSAFKKREWKYKSGTTKITLEQYWGSNDIDLTILEAPNLYWIANLTTISHKNESSFSDAMNIKEMDYTEQNAKFFVDLISALCLLNERILPIVKDENSLQNFIVSNQKLLG